MSRILHLDLDSFFVSVERLKNPKLLGKPVIVGGSSNRGVVASCSYEARKMGVRSAMPMVTALKLCKEAIVISGEMANYSYYSKWVTSIIHEKAPLYEKSSIDEFYIDLTGMDDFFGSEKWSHELRATIQKETGLPISWGLSKNKLISKIATGEAKPNGTKVVEPGLEQAFLDPLPIHKIPMLGKETNKLLEEMGLKTIRDLRLHSFEELNKKFGERGKMVWERANGIDYRKVVPYHEEKSMSSECTFSEDINQTDYLLTVLKNQAEKLGYQMRRRGKVCSVITVKIRYSDFKTVSKQIKIDYTQSDKKIMAIVEDLFLSLYQNPRKLRLVGVGLSGLLSGYSQLSLFEEKEDMRLLVAMDAIRDKFGKNSISRAVGLGGKRKPR